MRRALVLLLSLSCLVAIAGCGGDDAGDARSSSTTIDGEGGGPADTSPGAPGPDGPDRAFTGTRWVVEALTDGEVATSVPAGVTAELTFADDGTFIGSDGCGAISGTYLLEAGRLRFGPVTSMGVACTPPADEVADVVAEALTHAHDTAIDGEVLTLEPLEGPGLVLRAAG